MSDLTLRNGLVVTSGGILRGGLAVDNGVISYVGPDASLPPASRDIDVAGQVILPGLVDPHVHMGVPDSTREKMDSDFETESRDAAAGGVTTMVTMTLFGSEPRVEVAEMSLAAGDTYSQVDYRLTSVITKPEQLREIPQLVGLGVRSFKFLLGYKGRQAESFGMPPEGIPWDFFYQACEALSAAGSGAFATIHAEDPYVRDFLHDRLAGLAQKDFLQAWLETSPNILETMQVVCAALIAHEFATPLYVVHTSAWQSVEAIREFRRRGWAVHGETLAAFLYWTAAEADAKNIGSYGKVQPPLRTDRDREALWAGIHDGTISCVGTDSQRYTRESRKGDFWKARVGLGAGMGTLLPVMYTTGVAKGRISLDELARLVSENAARRFDLYPQKGVLQPGSDADIVVLDPDLEKVVVPTDLQGGSGYSMYESETLRGWPTKVFLRGNLIAEDGRVVATSPLGRHVGAVSSRRKQSALR